MTQPTRSWIPGLTAVVFVGAAAAARLLPHPDNVTPMIPMALFAGSQFAPAVAWPLVIGAMLAGDLALGWVPQNLSGYVALILIAALGAWVRRWPAGDGPASSRGSHRPRGWAIALATWAGSTLFFLVSNLGVWLEGLLYPRTAEGLVACYVAAIPFYRNQLVGDLAYSALLFGGFAVLCRWRGWVPARA